MAYQQKMKEFIFTVNFSYREWLGFYQGRYREIMVTTEDGKRLQIQADHFTKFTSPAGLYGRYKLVLTPSNKVSSLQKL